MTKIPETLYGLLQHYSPTGSVQTAVAWLVDHMTQTCGFTTARADAAGNALGIKGHGPNQFVFLGHIDTVPGEILLRVEGDTLFGRGAVDAKGPLAAFTDAVSSLEIRPDWQVIVIGAMDEEGDSQGARLVRDQYRPKYAIIGEPSQWNRITLGYKGVQNATLSLQRPQSHSSQGQSACDLLLESWQTLLIRIRDYNQDKKLFDQILPTVTDMQSSSNAFQMDAQMRISARLPQAVPPQTWERDWLASLPGVQIGAGGVGIQAYKADRNSDLARAFLGAIRSNAGVPSFVNKSGTADMNIVAPAWNCPIVAYGPGDSSFDHTPNEHINLPDYWQAVNVLKSVLIRLGVAVQTA
jgi:LysW-gamma-L-lysine carboxypeptidase